MRTKPNSQFILKKYLILERKFEVLRKESEVTGQKKEILSFDSKDSLQIHSSSHLILKLKLRNIKIRVGVK